MPSQQSFRKPFQKSFWTDSGNELACFTTPARHASTLGMHTRRTKSATHCFVCPARSVSLASKVQSAQSFLCSMQAPTTLHSRIPSCRAVKCDASVRSQFTIILRAPFLQPACRHPCSGCLCCESRSHAVPPAPALGHCLPWFFASAVLLSVTLYGLAPPPLAPSIRADVVKFRARACVRAPNLIRHLVPLDRGLHRHRGKLASRQRGRQGAGQSPKRVLAARAKRRPSNARAGAPASGARAAPVRRRDCAGAVPKRRPSGVMASPARRANGARERRARTGARARGRASREPRAAQPQGHDAVRPSFRSNAPSTSKSASFGVKLGPSWLASA